MALVSPGVEVTIIDQSQYLPAASNSVPLIVLATAQNKANAAGTGIAAATTAANANKLYQVTSQRDLVNLFGTPFFYKTTNGTPIQGYELNEYGLLAAYSVLGSTNRCFILRADIDLASLVGTLTRPVGDPSDGTYWLDTTTSTWGIYEFNQATGKFISITPLIMRDNDMVDNYPADFIGTIGQYGVYPGSPGETPYSQATYFYKNYQNTWVELGSTAWKASVPLAIGTVSYPTLTPGETFTINVNGEFSRTITVPASPNNTVDGISGLINGLGITYLSARNIDGQLAISYADVRTDNYIILTDGSGTPVTDMGLNSGTVYYAPDVSYGPSSSMPLWSASQSQPHPSGSVWIKTSVTGSGMNLSFSKYNSTLDAWVSVPVNKYSSTVSAIASLDTTGGKNIPLDTTIATLGNISGVNPPPNVGMQIFTRVATGATRKEGTVTDFTSNPISIGKRLTVAYTTPGSSIPTLASFITTGQTSAAFINDFNLVDMPNVSALYNWGTGAIVITHAAGGDVYLSDLDANGQSNGLLEEIGFDVASNSGVRNGLIYSFTVNGAATTSPSGSGATINVTVQPNVYQFTLASGGSGYSVGDLVTVSGSLIGGSSSNNLILSVQATGGSGAITELAFYSGTPRTNYTTALSNWELISDYIPNEGAPATNPINGTKWYYSTATEVDIMVQKNGAWYGYRNVAFDSNGHPATTGTPSTNPTGPILSTTAPTTQTDGSPLVYGDLWIDSNDLENYPVISRWQNVDGLDQWVQIDVTDQISQNGILFADARWGINGSVDPVSDPLSSITSLLTSDYTDLDAPNPEMYPQGMLLWNTRRSGYNVKEFRTNYFTSSNYPGESLPDFSYTWVSVSGLQSNGAAYMGRKAQRNLVVQALKSAIGTNQTIREEDTFFNLIATPNYPELQPDMVVLNNDRNNTAYIIGDTPLRLPDDATQITNWARNVNGATSTGEVGWVTRDTYLGVFYPSGITTDLTGASVVVPASHMMLRTFLRNDSIAYPWLAPAGTRRGTIDNATNIGYLDGATGEFVTIKNRMGIRDVLYVNQINPLAYFTGVGLLNYGNKNSFDSMSALDRINVARLICYIRERLQVAARPFVFEPNDAITRNEIQGVVQSLMVDLVAKRGLYDYLVVCDESNNTPARIDRNELWIDVAIEPVKAAEFIYIPVRVMNTGELQATA